MEIALIRIGLVLQMLSLPLLTPQVVGEKRMEALRRSLRNRVRPIAKVAGIVFAFTFLIAIVLVAIPFAYASANHTDVTAASFDSYPGWAQEMVKIAIWGAVVVLGGGVGITIALAVLAGLLWIATKKPQGFFLLGGCAFIIAVGLQFWATFYSEH